MLQLPALAAHRLGDQEVLDLEIVEAGRVELHELHVGDAAARPPRHRDAVAGRAARRGRIEIGAARAAGGEDRRPGGQRFDPLLLAVAGIEAVHRAAGREMRRVAAGDEVDRDHVGHQRDVRMLRRRGFERLADRPAGRVGDMDDPAVAVAALAGQVKRAILARERHAELDQIARSRAGACSTTCSTTRAVVEPRAGDHRVVDMRFEAVAFLQHRGDPALRPRARAVAKRALGDDRDLVRLGEVERRGQPGRARADDEDVGSRALTPLPASRGDQAQEHILEVGVAGRHVDDRQARRPRARSAPRRHSPCPCGR